SGHARALELEGVFALFPVLRERRGQLAGSLSGGEQQMLAIARAMMARPRLLMLDEPSLGLAPLLVREIFRIIPRLTAEGTAVLLVEQNARMVASGIHVFGLGLGGALGFGCVGMVAVAMAFNRVVLRRLFSRSLLSLIMVTIGLGIFMRGSAALVFAGIPGGIARPLPLDPVVIQGVPVSPDKL